MISTPPRYTVPGSGYPIRVQVRARELREAGWKMREVRSLLASEFGACPNQSTISRWTDGRQNAEDARSNARRSAQRRAAENGGRFLRLPQSPEFKLARMRGLREAGLKDTQIARVMNFDYGDSIDRETVGEAIARGRYPRRSS